jgi:uncharacterized protein
MKTLKPFIQRHPLLTYYILTFVISWGGLFVIGGPSKTSPGTSWQSDPRLPLMIFAMLGGPSIASVLLTSLVSGKKGWRDLRSGLFRWQVGARWYVVALLAAPLVYTAVHFALSLASPTYLPVIFTSTDKASLLLTSVVAGIVVGFCEELGWTGFAIPTMLQRYSIRTTGLTTGMLWGAWHLLTNDLWIGDTYAGNLSLAFFWIATGVSLLVGQLLAYRLLMVWVYERTRSLLVATLMHASLVVCTFIFGAQATGTAFLVYAFVLAGAWWIVVGAVGVAHRGHRRQEGWSSGVA